MNEPDPLELASLIAEALERCQIRYILGGSLASTALGEPRATLDVDIVVDLSVATVGPWLSLLGSDFSFDEEWARDEVARRGSFQLIHLPTMTRIDVFVPPWEGVHLWKWQHRRRLVLDEATNKGIDVTAPEGIVIQKLVWFRSGGESSDRQWRDVLGVLKLQRNDLDLADMRQWATELGVLDLLDRALQSCAPPQA
jgi:hypothetical protein